MPGGASRRRILLTFGIAVAVTLLVDVATKVAVVATLIDREPVKLFGGAVYLVHARNTGAAFSLATGYTVLLSCLAIGVSVYLIHLASRIRQPWWAVALGLICGGALGNVVDRIFRAPSPFKGGVVDFIALLDPVDPPWPIFNIADSALVVGVGMVIALELFGVRMTGKDDAVKDSSA